MPLMIFPAFGEDYTVRDRSGKVIERLQPMYQGADTLIRRDSAGRRIGTVEIGKDGSSVVRDNAGRRIGSTTRR